MKISQKDDFATKRKLIDAIDEKILSLLKKRFFVTKEIGIIKKQKGLAIFDKGREDEIIAKLTVESGMNKDFIAKLFKVIFKESKRLQK